MPFIAIYLLGFIFKIPSPDIVKEAPVFKYIVPSFSLFGESSNVDSPSNTNLTSIFSFIIKGVNSSSFVKMKSLKFIVHEDAIIIFLSSCSPVNSKGPAPLIVTTLSDMVYPSFVVGEVKETVTVD